MLKWKANSVGFLFAKSGDYTARIAGGGYLWKLEIWHWCALVHKGEYHPTNTIPGQQTLEDAKQQFETFVFNDQKQ